MGFTLKKIIGSLIMPLPFGVLLGLVGLFFLYRNSLKLAKIFLSVSFIWIIVFSYSPISNALITSLEKQYQPIKNIDTSIDYVLLLGGDFEARAYGVLELYNQNKNITIITSGYGGTEPIPEAIQNKEKLIKLGVPENKIITQGKPKDTHEEAVMVKKIVADEKFYLVTSAYHMPRALKLFKKENLNAIPAPTGYMDKTKPHVDFATEGEIKKSRTAIHEYIGNLWNRFKDLFLSDD